MMTATGRFHKVINGLTFCLHWLLSSSPDRERKLNYSVVRLEPYPHESYKDLASFQSHMFSSHYEECLYRQLIYAALSDTADWTDEE